jgi:hypothetical protein
LVLDSHLKALGPIWSSLPVRMLDRIGPCSFGPLSKVALILSILQKLLWSYKYSTDISCLHVACWVQKVGRNRDQWFFFGGENFCILATKKVKVQNDTKDFFVEKMGPSHHIMRKNSKVAKFRQRSNISSKHKKPPNFFYFPFSDLYPNLVNSSCGWWPVHLTHIFEEEKHWWRPSGMQFPAIITHCLQWVDFTRR